MKDKKMVREPHLAKRARWWQIIVIILLIIAMPLFFAFVRNNQMQRAIQSMPREQNQNR